MIIVRIVCENPPQMALVEHDATWRHSRRIDPMSRSTYGDCPEERGAVTTSLMSMFSTQRRKNSPQIESRSANQHVDVLAGAGGALVDGQFPPGTMGPKIDGALNFLSQAESDDAYVIIGPLEKTVAAVAGNVGTRIVK